MFKQQKEFVKSVVIESVINPEQADKPPFFVVTINQSSNALEITNHAKKSTDYFKFEVNQDTIKISINPEAHRDETNALFSKARTLLWQHSIITSLDREEIINAYGSHLKKHTNVLSNSRGNHNIEREHHGGYSF